MRRSGRFFNRQYALDDHISMVSHELLVDPQKGLALCTVCNDIFSFTVNLYVCWKSCTAGTDDSRITDIIN